MGAYTKTTWQNDAGPAINATNLNKMEDGIQQGEHLMGTLAAMTGALAIANPDCLYWASDDNGGTLYRSNGTTWDRVAPGVNRVQSSLPSSPYDGQIIDYVADATNGVVWRFRYRSAASGSYKWEFIGGAPLVAATGGGPIAAGESYSSGSYGNCATVGPSITVPLAGDYDVRIGMTASANTASKWVVMSYAIGAAAADDADACGVYATSGNIYPSVGRGKRKTGLAASTALVAKYRVDTVATADIRARWMEVCPVRVG